MAGDTFVTLERDMPRKFQAGCTALLGLVPGLIGVGVLIQTWRYWRGWDDDWGMVFFGGVFALVGLGMLTSALHQWVASAVPETIVAIDPLELHAGSGARLRIRQPGPVRLKSLNARLVCEIVDRHPSETRPGEFYYTTRYPTQDRIVASESRYIPAGGSFDEVAEFRVPSDGEPSIESQEHRVRWRIEVWGRVRWWPDFMHPFTVQVKNRGLGTGDRELGTGDR